MENNGFIGVPIGGVIPWIGEAYGIELPENFAILDGDITNVIPTESPFYNLIDDLPNMENLTFHCVEGDTSLLSTQGSDSVNLSLSTTNLPIDYGYECVNGTYTTVSNYEMDSGVITASFGTTTMLTNSRYFGSATINLDNTEDSASGSGDGYLEYSTSANAYNNAFSHRHYADVSHTHSISSSGTSYEETENVSWGTFGSGDDVVISTTPTDLPRATCYFVIRLW